MEDFTILHNTNIIIHVFTGSMALLLGLIIIISKKGNNLHKRLGKIFLGLVSMVIITGLLGVFIFGRNNFLLVITMLSAYNAYSGFRVVRLKSNEARPIDIIVAMVTLSSGLFYLYYIKSIGMIWSPIVIYSTLSALFAIIFYDFFRYFIPKSRYKNIWLYEHIYKMIAAFTALLSAFVGTVLPHYQPYSQFLPSVFGTLLAISFILYFYRKNRVLKK